MGYRYLDDFRRGISVFAIFSYGIAVLGTPQCPPPQNESTTNSNEGRMSEARYFSVDLWLLLYGKPRSLQNMFFVNFLSLV